MTRRQAVPHSCLVMWVAASQKPMQASKLSPPPPGVLGRDSLGLALAGGDPPPPGKVAVLPGADPPPPGKVAVPPVVVPEPVAPPPGTVTVPPPLRKLEVVGGDSGATGAARGAGAATPGVTVPAPGAAELPAGPVAPVPGVCPTPPNPPVVDGTPVPNVPVPDNDREDAPPPPTGRPIPDVDGAAAPPPVPAPPPRPCATASGAAAARKRAAAPAAAKATTEVVSKPATEPARRGAGRATDWVCGRQVRCAIGLLRRLLARCRVLPVPHSRLSIDRRRAREARADARRRDGAPPVGANARATGMGPRPAITSVCVPRRASPSRTAVASAPACGAAGKSSLGR
jgi:hypothetical protein